MYDCFLTYISYLPFEIKPHVGTVKMDMGGYWRGGHWISLFVLSDVATLIDTFPYSLLPICSVGLLGMSGWAWLLQALTLMTQ